MSERERLGRGLGLPLRPGPQGAFTVRSGTDKVAESIRIILETAPGERVMRPDFGCGLRRFEMQPNSSATRAQIAREVERALLTWEPRINLVRVDARADRDPAVVLIEVHYTHARTGRPDNLVFPFYLEVRS